MRKIFTFIFVAFVAVSAFAQVDTTAVNRDSVDVVDVATLILWCSIGNVFMIMQYVFWTLNCVYGYYKWS